MPYKNKKVFLWLHVAWLLIWGLVVIIMLLPQSQRDTPAMLFVFYPIIYWVGGHLLLLFLQFIYRIGNRAALRYNATDTHSGWPWQVNFALIILGISTFKLLYSLPILYLIYIGKAKGGVPAIMLSIYILGLIALYGVIARTRIGYRLILGYCYILFIFFSWILVFFIYDGHSSANVLFVLAAMVCLYAIYIYSFSTSKNVKRFFGLI